MDLHSVRATLAALVDQLGRPDITPGDLVDITEAIDRVHDEVDRIVFAAVALEEAETAACV